MKVYNVLGNVYKGTVGKMVTAGSWHGRNYLRGWRKPKNPQTRGQTTQRDIMIEASDEWNELNNVQRYAYKRSLDTMLRHITHYNGMVKSYINLKIAGDVYLPPAHGTVHVKDAVTGDPLYLASVRFTPHNRTSPVYVWYTDIDGNYGPIALTKEDEPYTGQVVMSGYSWKYLAEVTAEEIITTHELTPS